MAYPGYGQPPMPPPIPQQGDGWNPFYSSFDYHAYSSFFYQLSQAASAQAKAANAGIPPGFDAHQCRSLYIGNLSDRVSETLLYEVFAAFGPIESCKVIKDKVTGQNAGYGFIDYFDHNTAAFAMQSLSGKLLYNSEIKINWAFASGQKPGTTTTTTTTPSAEDLVKSGSVYHIFVGDLGPDVDDKALYNAFAPYGQVSEARVMLDPNTGRSRGYGFVAFKRKDEAQRALTEMNGQHIGNRAIRCNWANQKGSLFDDTPPSNGLDYGSVSAQTPSSNTTVYIGNINSEVSEHTIKMIFSEYGLVEEVKLSPDKGFGFVRFQTHDGAAKAIVGCHGKMVGSRPLRCSWGKERPNVLPPPAIQTPGFNYSYR